MSSYPAVPGEKIAYDEDGTIMWEAKTLAGGSFGGGGVFTAMILPPTELSLATKAEYNDEDTISNRTEGGPGAVDYGYAWIWPEKRDIFGFYGYVTDNDTNWIAEIYSSTDTKNGVTGNFNIDAHGGGSAFSTANDLTRPDGNNNWSVQQSYREFIHGFTSTGTRCVRARVQVDKRVPAAVDKGIFCAFHWYGSIADAANPDRLVYIDADTGLAYDEVQDWGDIPRGSVHDKEFYILNNSATLAATSNVLSLEGGFEDSFTWYTLFDEQLSTRGFSTTLTIDGPLAAGARYPTASTDNLIVRLTVDPAENLGPAAARIQLVTGTWA